jgi:hypothetical protein
VCEQELVIELQIQQQDIFNADKRKKVCYLNLDKRKPKGDLGEQFVPLKQRRELSALEAKRFYSISPLGATTTIKYCNCNFKLQP